MASADRPLAISTVQIENDLVRVTEWRFPPGTSTGFHRHAHDYVVVPMTTGKLMLEEPGGTSRTVDLVTGKPYFRGEGVEHNVVNASPGEFVFIEVEVKR